ncbi:MAG: hypothetical protein GXZ04_06885 [Clostridiales bacterium]|nr:hypothetical protein [Clostridiales bacterium]
MNTPQTIVLSADKQGFFTVTAHGHTWRQDSSHRPCVRTKAGTLFFDQAQDISLAPYKTGLGAGYQLRYSGFPGSDAAFETLLWVDDATSRLHCLFVPLSLNEVVEVCWPAPMVADEPGSYAVVPYMQGYLLPTDWPQEAPKPPFNGQMCSSAAYMPWLGEITPKGGYLLHVTKPWDSAYDCLHPAGGPTRLSVRHLPSLGQMQDERSVTYQFTKPGSDYVTLCKLYRGMAEEAGLAVPLSAKGQRADGLDRLIGSSVLHVGIKTHISPDSAYYDQEHPEKNDEIIPFSQRADLVKQLTKAGAPRLYLHLDGWGEPGYDNQHPDYLPACEKAGGYPGLIALRETCRELGHLFGLHDQYRDYYFDAASYDPDNALMLADGTLFEFARWAGGWQNYLCPALSPHYLRRNYTELFRQGVTMDCVYLDVFTCNEPDECLNPRHRVTRKESLAHRLSCFDYMLAQGILPSSEEAIDWALPSLVFCHWAPYAQGGIPVPLFNLVYHDCVLIPWMLGKGSWGTPKGDLGFLHALLNAGMGYVADSLTGEAQKENLAQLKVLSALQTRLAHQQMVSHRFLSEDTRVQQATYEDGTTVTVDFNQETYEIKPPLEGV